jgi:hypothetical protein
MSERTLVGLAFLVLAAAAAFVAWRSARRIRSIGGGRPRCGAGSSSDDVMPGSWGDSSGGGSSDFGGGSDCGSGFDGGGCDGGGGGGGD